MLVCKSTSHIFLGEMNRSYLPPPTGLGYYSTSERKGDCQGAHQTLFPGDIDVSQCQGPGQAQSWFQNASMGSTLPYTQGPKGVIGILCVLARSRGSMCSEALEIVSPQPRVMLQILSTPVTQGD